MILLNRRDALVVVNLRPLSQVINNLNPNPDEKPDPSEDLEIGDLALANAARFQCSVPGSVGCR